MKHITIVIILLIACGLTYGQTIEEAVSFLEGGNGIGVRAQAMGGAMTAAANDYSAIYFNPACLTLLKSSELTGSMYHMKFRNESIFSGNTVMENDSFNQFSSLGLAYKFPTTRGSMVIAFGYNRFKDFNDFTYFTGFNTLGNGLGFDLEDVDENTYYFPYDSDVQQTEDIRENGHLGEWSVGGGIALSPSFSVGVTFSRIKGFSEYDFRFYQDDVDDLYFQYPANYDSYELYQYINSEFKGNLTRIGGLFNFSRDLRFGLSADLPSTLHVMETYSSDDIIYFDDETVSEYDIGSGEWEYLVKYPSKLSAGLALDTDVLLAAASCEYRDWTQTRFDIPYGFERTSDYDDLLSDNILFRNRFRPVLSYSIGGELRVPGTGLKLRGGYRVVPSPLFDAEKELDRIYISAGIGLDLDARTSLNVSYINSKWSRYTEDDYTPGGTAEDIRTDRIMAGISYRL